MNPVETLFRLSERGNDIVPFDVAIASDSEDLLLRSMREGGGREESNAKGTIGELWLEMFLLRHGYEPYLPLPGRLAKHDMLAVHIESGKVVKIQVKSSVSPNTSPVMKRPEPNQIYVQLRFFECDSSGKNERIHLQPVVGDMLEE